MKVIRAFTLVVAAALALPVPGPAVAQSTSSDFTSHIRYDTMGRAVGTISAAPDNSTSLPRLATRTTYDTRGLPIKVEQGTLASFADEDILPEDWADFTPSSWKIITYDAYDRKSTESLVGADGVAIGLTQYSYDSLGRLECTAVRMNPAAYGSLPSDACTLGAEGSEGPDRIARTIYDAAGQVLQIRKAVGTPIEIADVTYSYTDNGKIKQVVDANGNRAELRYDGHDRQNRWVFPSKTRPTAFNKSTPATALSSAGALNESDYEEYGYDANGNRTSLRKRDGSTLTYSYDNLNRMTVKTVPSRAGLSSTHTRNVHYKYDLRGLQTDARFDSAGGLGAHATYDGFRAPTDRDQHAAGRLPQADLPVRCERQSHAADASGRQKLAIRI